MQYTEEQIQNKFDNLPKDIQEAISSTDTTNKIVDIAQHYKIHINKIEQIVSEITLFMLGLEKLETLKRNLRDKVGMSRELVDTVIKDVDEQVFSNIRTSIRKIQLSRKEEEEIDKVRPAEKVDSRMNSSQTQQKESLLVQEDKKTDFTQITPQTIPETDFTTKLVDEAPTTPIETPNEPLISQGQEKERAQILKEIENPLSEIDKQPKPQENTVPSNLPSESISEKPIENVIKPNILDEKIIPNTPQSKEDTQNTPKTSIIENKLNHVVKVPIQEKNISEKLPQETNIIDPYREPIE